MKKRKKSEDRVATAAASVAKAGRPKEGPEKKVVTLYLEADLYARVQKLHGRQVSTLVNNLLRAFLLEGEGSD